MPTKGCKNGLGLRPKNPVALLCWIRIRTARRWASKVSVTHFYRRCAGAQNGEPPPHSSPPQRRGTMGRENGYFKVGGLRFLQALTPQERYSRFIVASPSGPLSRGGKGGGGKGQMRLRLPWERFCAQYGLICGSRRKSIRIQHSQRQGSWGRAPSVFCGIGPPAGREARWGKEERRSVGGLPIP